MRHALLRRLTHGWRRSCVAIGMVLHRRSWHRIARILLEPCAEAQVLSGYQLASLAVSLWALGRDREAGCRFEEAIASGEDTMYVNHWYGQYLIAHDPDDVSLRRAERCFEVAYALARENGASKIMQGCRIGLAYCAFPDRLEMAAELYRSVLSEEPSLYEGLYGLGMACVAMHKWDEGLPYLRHALRQRPRSADAHYELGNALCGLGNFREAESHYLSALELNVCDPAFACYGVALCALENGRQAVARQYALKAIEYDAGYEQPWRLLEELGDSR